MTSKSTYDNLEQQVQAPEKKIFPKGISFPYPSKKGLISLQALHPMAMQNIRQEAVGGTGYMVKDFKRLKYEE